MSRAAASMKHGTIFRCSLRRFGNKELSSRLPVRWLTYLDPPYFVKGQQRLYANYYEAADHAKIADLLANFPRCWIVSYDYAPEILAQYSDYRCVVYGLRYSATERYDGSEVMFFSDQLQIPDMSAHVGLSVSVFNSDC
jgi:DNA adenine methylase